MVRPLWIVAAALLLIAAGWLLLGIEPEPASAPGADFHPPRATPQVRQARAPESLVRSAESNAPGLERVGDGPTAQQEPAQGGPRVWTQEEIRADRQERMQVQQSQQQANQRKLQVAKARFEQEGRDEPWSGRREAIYRQAAEQGDVERMLVGVECRQTLCKLDWEAVDTHSMFRIQRSPAYGEMGGPERTALEVEGTPAQRILTFYAPRSGQSFESGKVVSKQ